VCPQFNSAGRHFCSEESNFGLSAALDRPPTPHRIPFALRVNQTYLRKVDATVAQLVEQTIRNRQVSGSIPLGGLLGRNFRPPATH
jgi:hypothetical protein